MPVECWVGVTGRGQPWELLSSWPEGGHAAPPRGGQWNPWSPGTSSGYPAGLSLDGDLPHRAQGGKHLHFKGVSLWGEVWAWREGR